MVVALGDGRSVPAEPFTTPAVCIEDRAVDVGSRRFEPAEERGAEVERDHGIVIDDRDDIAVGVEDPRGGIRCVAFRGDALVPIVIRIGRILELDLLEPWVLAGWLVEMAVDTDISWLGHWTSPFGSIQRTGSFGLPFQDTSKMFGARALSHCETRRRPKHTCFGGLPSIRARGGVSANAVANFEPPGKSDELSRSSIVTPYL